MLFVPSFTINSGLPTKDFCSQGRFLCLPDLLQFLWAPNNSVLQDTVDHKLILSA